MMQRIDTDNLPLHEIMSWYTGVGYSAMSRKFSSEYPFNRVALLLM